MPYEFYVLALLFGLIVLAVMVSISDIKTRRIPNLYLMYGCYYILGIFILMFFSVPIGMVLKGVFMNLLGAILGGLILYLPYKYRQVGAGDVKLVMVFGLFLGLKGAMLSILMGAMIGGLWALFLAWRLGGLSHLFYNIKFMMRSLYLSGFKEMSWDLRSEGAIAMPYGVALSVGAVIIALEQMKLYFTKLQALGIF